MSEENKEPAGNGEQPAGASAGNEIAEKIQANYKTLGMEDKLVLFGSAALLLLSFIRWRGSSNAGMNGWQDYHVLGMLACIGTIVVTLLKMDKPDWLQAALAAGAWVLGPLAYWMHYDVPKGVIKLPLAEMMPSRTLFFWLALIAGLVAAIAAGRKYWEHRQKTRAQS